MAIIREEYNIRRASKTAAAAIDVSVYDVGLRYTTDGQVTPVGAAEVPPMLAAESATAADEAVSVIYLQRGLHVGLRIAGTVGLGQKIETDASGHFVASSTAETDVLAATDIGIALEAGVDTDTIQVDLIGV